MARDNILTSIDKYKAVAEAATALLPADDGPTVWGLWIYELTQQAEYADQEETISRLRERALGKIQKVLMRADNFGATREAAVVAIIKHVVMEGV